jgi:hypothetical protein
MTTPRPLSPAAQAVLDAFREKWADEFLRQDVRCLAAAIRALADQVAPEEEPFRGGMRPGGTQHVVMEEFRQAQRRHTRAQQLAIAAELDGGEPQPTPTETTDEHA